AHQQAGREAPAADLQHPSTPTDEVDDLHHVAIVYRRFGDCRTADDFAVEFDHDCAGIELQLGEQLLDGPGRGDLANAAIDRQLHGDLLPGRWRFSGANCRPFVLTGTILKSSRIADGLEQLDGGAILPSRGPDRADRSRSPRASLHCLPGAFGIDSTDRVDRHAELRHGSEQLDAGTGPTGMRGCGPDVPDDQALDTLGDGSSCFVDGMNRSEP